jgi:predicted Zn-ribbon and HTH transcriptional regulator
MVVQIGNTIDPRPLMQAQALVALPCTCTAGVEFHIISGRIKPCPKCRNLKTNAEARAVVAKLLDALRGELAARGGTTEDALLRLTESPSLLAERLSANVKLVERADRDQFMVDDHCNECGEFESECICT